ncbi:hypothetical protein MKK88_05845 [Methylobacterium sp. E-005]|uniref:hypothetical protein n=1 Tax=Methylobacterium sp. E-005 TaxID=2836549 RepID=UPI001FB8850D|nr:hypothetical protein [Methylobacterium sp. E-005]MCJ2085517.1 hypothetical protein [Methylobacterium sp. E-005]
MLRILLLALALAAGVSGAAQAQTQRVISGCGSAAPVLGPGAPDFANPVGSHCVDTTVQGTAVYRGNTIAVGGTSQQLMATNPARRGFTVQNQSTGDLYIKIGATATTNNLSLKIAAGAYYETSAQHVSTGAVNIVGATTGQAFYATEY